MLEERRPRPRPAGLGPDRLGQDRGLRSGRGRDPAGRRRDASVPPARRWPWSSPRPANWRCRCRPSWTGSTPRPAPRSSPASAAWTPAREAARAELGCHIVVGTPGRLSDHLERGNLDLSAPAGRWCSTRPTRCSTWASARTWRTSSTPSPAERRTLLFSATIARDIATLAKRYQRDAVRIDTVGRDAAARRHRIPRHPRRPERDRARRRQRAALLRGARRPGLLRTRDSVRHLHVVAARARLLGRGPLRRDWASASAPTPCRRCATAAPASASPPTWPRAASTCPTWAW